MSPRRSCRPWIVAAVVLVLTTGWADAAFSQALGLGQAVAEEMAPSPWNPRFPQIPEQPPQPQSDVARFVNPLSNTDGVLHVVVGQGRLLTLKDDILAEGRPQPLIAVGDPTVIDFEVLGPRHIRLTGFRIGVTDLSILTADRSNYTFEVHVVADLDVLSARLRQVFPGASVKLTQVREHVVVEGEARDARQVSQIIQTVEAYLESIHNSQVVTTRSKTDAAAPDASQPPRRSGPSYRGDRERRFGENGEGQPLDAADAEAAPESYRPETTGQILKSQVINLLRVPGPQQVLLKVQVAELNRTAFRKFGFSFLYQDGSSAVGSNVAASSGNLGGGIPPVGGDGGAAGFARLLNPLSATTTIFGVLENGKFNYFLDALRRNNLLKILAEPNLVALNGQEASFLAGGEFPVPVPQSGAGGGTPTVTVIYKKFGVQLRFKPIINDNDSIRLAVAPEVSSIDDNLGVVLEGFRIPALNTRTANTVVELHEGQTLAIAGLLQISLEGNTDKVPGLGDLKYIGPFFSNTSGEKVEKELIVLVTPYLVEAANASELPPLPGAEVHEPTDLELYLLGRIEGRTHCRYRSPTRTFEMAAPMQVIRLEQKYLRGPFGFSH